MIDGQTLIGDQGLKTYPVYLVGSGPGDPELLTVKARRLMEEVDVVVHDRLVAEPILQLLPDSTERIFAGKKAVADVGIENIGCVVQLLHLILIINLTICEITRHVEQPLESAAFTHKAHKLSGKIGQRFCAWNSITMYQDWYAMCAKVRLGKIRVYFSPWVVDCDSIPILFEDF